MSYNLNLLLAQKREIRIDQQRKISLLSKAFIYVSDSSAYCNNNSTSTIKLAKFIDDNDTYFEVGSRCGASALLLSKVINRGKMYLFEANKYYFQILQSNIFLNNKNNIYIENLEVLNEEHYSNTTSLKQISQKLQIVPNVIRIDNAAYACETLRGAEDIIQSNSDLRIFINWQKEHLYTKESLVSLEQCLAGLTKMKFLFFDYSQDIDLCNYQEYALTLPDVLKSNNIEFMAVQEETIERYLDRMTDPIKSGSCKLPKLNHNLFFAASYGKVDEVKKYLERGANVDYLEDGTALYIASQNGHIEVVRLLIQNKANLEINSVYGLSPLYVAILNKHLNIAELLLLNSANTENAIPSGSTPLYYAAYYGYLDGIKLLLKYGANKNVVLNGLSIVQVAQNNGHNGVVQLLQNNHEYSEMLFSASQVGDFVRVEELIMQGADVNSLHSQLQATSLYIASQNGHTKVVELLLTNKANPEICWGSMSPLFMAVQNKHKDIARLLLKYGASSETGKSAGVTALYIAVTQEDDESVELLLEYKANTEIKIGEYTPLSLAVYNGLIKIVKLLVQYGANREVTIDGFNLLYIAAKRGFIEIAEVLLESGLKINEGQVNGKTALDIAAEHNKTEMVKFLLAKGASIGVSQKQVFKILMADEQAKNNLFDHKYEDSVIEVVLKQQNSSAVAVDTFTKLIKKMTIIKECLQGNEAENINFVEACGLDSPFFMEHYHE